MSPARQNPTKDRISELPDPVLYLTLSFLPIKEVFATSVLSRRWKLLWCSLPTLKINDKSFATFKLFHHFLYSFFLSRPIHLPFLTFHLTCGNSSPCDPFEISRFVYTAMLRGLRHLHLEMVLHIRIKLPANVLSCTTLTVIKLKNLSLDNFSLAHFPSLKTLHLDRVSFPTHKHVMLLLSKSPILEDLLAQNLFVYRPHRSVEEQLKSFPNLLRANISNLYIPLTPLHKAHFLRVELKSAYYSGFPRFHNLTHMEVIFDFSTWQWHWNWLVKALQHCPKLQSLTIDKTFLYKDGLCDDDWEAPPSVPECLSTQLKTCLFRHCGDGNSELGFAKYIIQNAKVLHTMTIQSSFFVKVNGKFQMLQELCSCPRGSATCKVIFE